MDYEDQDDLKFLDDVVESLYEELEVAKNTNAALTKILNLAGEATVEIEEKLANQMASEDFAWRVKQLTESLRIAIKRA